MIVRENGKQKQELNGTGCIGKQLTSIGGSKIMGLAATQARFLELTARKSNVEFQGQQINQQRTTLANETSAYNEQLLGMSVPTAPSTDSYTKTTYTFTDTTGFSGTVSGVTYNNDGSINLGYTYQTTESEAETGTALFYSTTTGGTTTNGVTTGGTTNYFVGSGSNQTALSAVSLDSLSADDQTNLKLIYGDKYNSKDANSKYNNAYYKYSNGGSVKYVTLADLQNTTNGANTASNMVYHYVNENATATKNASIKNAVPTWTTSGRLSKVVTDKGTTNEHAYNMSATSKTDQDAYSDAMNEYNYQKALYDQGLNNINAKLSVVQQQDKTLELKLKDVDTEQQAISTEMDAVKKVADKNVESTFKTFG